MSPGRGGPAAPGERSRPLAGTGGLLRLGLRRERLALPAWLLANAALLGGTAAVYGHIYSGADVRSAAVARSESAALRGLNGAPAADSAGSLAFTDTFTLATALASLMAVSMVLRQTRQNDAAGRAELVASTAVGRHAPLLAALLLGAASCAVLVPVVAFALAITGLPLSGSFAAGGAIASVGLVFAAVATMTAQLWPSTSASTWDAVLVMTLVALPRAVGDAASEPAPGGVGVERGWISWISPATWAQEVRPFHGDNWPLLIPVAALALPIALQGFRLSRKRDPGTSVFTTDTGSPAAAPALRGTVSLFWRLRRAALTAWVAGAFLGALCLGLLGVVGLSGPWGEAAAFSRFARGLGLAADEAFALLVGELVAVAAMGSAAHVLLAARGEEPSGRLALLLGAAPARTRWFAAHAALALVGPAVVVAGGAGAGLGTGLRAGDLGGGLAQAMAAAATQVPAVLLFTGVLLAMLGAAPRMLRPLPWAAAGAVLLLAFGLAGRLLGLPAETGLPVPIAGGPDPVFLAGLLAAGPVLAWIGGAVFARRTIGG